MDGQFKNGVNGMMPQGKKGLAIAAMVLGIVSCVLAWFYGINAIALVTGIVGLILAILAMKSYKDLGQKNGIATAGLVLSIIGTVLAAIGFFACTVCVCCAAKSVTGMSVSELNNLANQLGSLG